ncbi:putative membrane protein [Halapricum desulfuricans]|uniref:Putative membrane protein n=1 Tax=Halapricum desulfuricans TaxID=2841257 RepID=A0A897NC87_9EURY|nr:carotenoid biosynthesis protein [Halapricum desulfuricans]QSG12030.1 putative membrane protein [Halapricum desulfuricans]
MASRRVFALSTVGLGLLGLAHAIVTWPVAATIALFGGGAAIAFVAETLVVALGWLEHHVDPKVGGVPLYVLFGWTVVIYLAFRLALLVTDGWTAVVATAVVATAYDVLTDHRGVDDGHWTYTDDLPGPRYRGVPWWNYLGWLFISFLTAAVTVPFL